MSRAREELSGIKPCASYGHAQANEYANELDALCDTLRNLPELASKRAISLAATDYQGKSIQERYAMPGDDCAAFKTEGGYQLLAMEGMLPNFVRQDPRAAGWSAVMVNVSDIAAMGGRAQAVVNAYWHNDNEQAAQLIFHMQRACDVFGVQFAGGHSSLAQGNSPNLAMAITGFAQKLLSCHHVQPGQRLFLLTDLTGSWHGDLPYWGCVPGKTKEQVRAQWAIPAELAEESLVVAAKDVSNGGILGTLIMLLELTGCGAKVDLSAIPKPGNDLLRWMRAFQSYGFLLAVEPSQISRLIRFFNHSHLTCSPIGEINDSGIVELDMAGTTAEFWDIKKQPLTHMGVSQAGAEFASEKTNVGATQIKPQNHQTNASDETTKQGADHACC